MSTLTKYAKALNLASSTSNDKNIDSATPYNFRQWQSRNIGIISSNEFEQYNEYLKNWYIDRKEEITSVDYIRAQYINLLIEINTIFRDTNLDWITEANLQDDWDLETVIHFYSRKLKEIAFHIISQREMVKKAKLRYNMVGANQALEKLFYEYILLTYTKRPYSLVSPTASAWECYPVLSDVSGKFQITIEELYDDEEYYDKNPNLSASEYFDLNSPTLLDFIGTQNFPISALEWLYSAGFNDVSANNIAIWIPPSAINLPLSAYEAGPSSNLNEYNYFDLSKKYLGEKQWLAEGGYYIPFLKLVTFDVKALNNWFYWPSGEFYAEVDKLVTYDPILLSDTNFAKLGTASVDFISADKIFVQKGLVTEAAWLAQVDYKTTSETMSAFLKANDSTVFKFPWPGYGLSGDDFNWTGPSLINADKSFEYLETKYRNAVIDAYWSQTKAFDDFNIEPILLNDTNLINNNATAATNFVSADKVTVRDMPHDETPDGIYTGAQQYAWLYDYDYTQIPIAIGENSILWPLERIDTSIISPSATLPITCENVALSSITNLAGSTAGFAISSSDVIFKLNAFGDEITDVAWLSGTTFLWTFEAPYAVIQDGFATKVNPGEYSLFLWTGNTTDVNEVFKYHKHASDCPYKVSSRNPKPLEDVVDHEYNTEIGTDRWDYCNCRAFHYSPCGHSGEITDYSGVHDFIIEDFNYPDPFNLSTWHDLSGNLPIPSPSFVWYKTSAPGINFESGSWINPTSGDSLNLLSGHIYRYYRTNLKRDPKQFSLPYLVAFYQNINNPLKPIWIGAEKQSDGTWTSTSTISNMILRPGDSLNYYHIDTSSTADSTTVNFPSVNFVFTIPITSTPYWAVANDDIISTHSKGVAIYGGKRMIIDDYLLIDQPKVSNILLKNGTYLEYERYGNSIVWTENLQLQEHVDQKIWNTILTDTISGLNIVASISASNIILESNPVDPIKINYYAINPFTLTQELTSSSLGIPPTGGVYVPSVSSTLVEPPIPYTNFTNRHFPTNTSAPTIGKFYSEADVGGYFLPKNLGISVYLGKQYEIGWTTPNDA